MLMRAVNLTEYGGPEVLKIRQQAIPEAGPQQLLVKVKATALNRADILQRRGLYPLPEGATTILGLELAGEVVALGEEVSEFKEGDRVFGLVVGGAYADYCVIDAGSAMHIPSTLSYEQAAAIPEAFLTAQQAVFALGELQKGQRLLIHAAASGVGSAAVQMAHCMGCEIYATAGSEKKCQKVQALGADCVINYKEQDFSEVIQQHTDTKGVDVIVDFIGKDYFARNLALLSWKGRLVQVGMMSGSCFSIDLKPLLFKHLQIKGLVMRKQSLDEKRNMVNHFKHHWLECFSHGTLQPIIDCVYPFSAVKAAHQHMEENKNIGKILLSID